MAHRNGLKLCNHYTNLYYATPKENTADVVKHGRMMRGTKQHLAKLDEDMVREIRASSEILAVLAERMGVDISTVSAARRGKTWAHVV